MNEASKRAGDDDIAKSAYFGGCLTP